MSEVSPQKWAKADINQIAVADAHTHNDESGTVKPCSGFATRVIGSVFQIFAQSAPAALPSVK
jgi:hypothetical protein